mmetsp:Transcript_3716/g.10906  ORF Transcript_3716/g.10906 Transcript_3716/m.10906 type:complete len:86 (-) Transcript_3716:20-277(-)
MMACSLVRSSSKQSCQPPTASPPPFSMCRGEWTFFHSACALAVTGIEHAGEADSDPCLRGRHHLEILRARRHRERGFSAPLQVNA